MKIKTVVISVSILFAAPLIAIAWNSFQLINTYRNIPDEQLRPDQVISIGNALHRDTEDVFRYLSLPIVTGKQIGRAHV